MIPVAEDEAPENGTTTTSTTTTASKKQPQPGDEKAPIPNALPQGNYSNQGPATGMYYMSYPESSSAVIPRIGQVPPPSPPSVSSMMSSPGRVDNNYIPANSNNIGYYPYNQYSFAPSHGPSQQDLLYQSYNPVTSPGIFQMYESPYERHPYSTMPYHYHPQLSQIPHPSPPAPPSEVAMIRSYIDPDLDLSNHTAPPLSPTQGNPSGIGRSTSSQNLSNQSSGSKSFDPLSIKDKICPEFLSDLFQPYIDNQINNLAPVAANFQDAHSLMKSILLQKNVKDNLISYRTDTKRGKRDYKIRTYRITLIEGKGGIFFFSFGEIVTQQQQQPANGNAPSNTIGIGKKRRNTEDSLSSRKSLGGKSSSSNEHLNDHPPEADLNYQKNVSHDQFDEDLDYDLMHLDEIDSEQISIPNNSTDISIEDPEPLRNRRKLSHDDLVVKTADDQSETNFENIFK